jgi:hypothetical protein
MKTLSAKAKIAELLFIYNDANDFHATHLATDEKWMNRKNFRNLK